MAGLISDNTLDRIRAANDIVDVIGGYLPLKRAGGNFTALCPFHKEKSPSFNVNPHKQIFHCFGCHKGGDVFTFVKEYENIGFVDAVRRLADRAKIPLEMDNNPATQEARHIKDQLLQIHDQLTTRWQSCLANEAAGQLARDYLTKRGVSEEGIKLFRIGAAPEAWDDTVNWATSKGFDLATVEKAGLIIKKEETGRYYDRFRGRLMFPICDEQGRVIGFSGRILSGDEKTAKYVNSPETPIFTKSKVFFALDKSKRAILDAGFAIVCEGQLDSIACFMGGVQNIVAPQGTAFTDQHARIIKRYVDEVVLCFDSDNAGQNAAVRALDSLLSSGLAVRVAVMPPKDDPDSFIKAHGGEAFRELIKNADGFFDYYLKRLCTTNDISTDKGRLTVVKEMSEAVRKTGNPVLIDKYAQKTALRLGVTPEATRKEFSKSPTALVAISTEVMRSDTTDSNSEATISPPNRFEFGLLQILFREDDIAAWTSKHLDASWIIHTEAREIVSERLKAEITGSWNGISNYLNSLSESRRNFLSEAITSNYVEGKVVGDLSTIKDPKRGRMITDIESEIAGIVLRLRNQFCDQQIALLQQQVDLAMNNDSLRADLMKQQIRWRDYKKQPLAPLETV